MYWLGYFLLLVIGLGSWLGLLNYLRRLRPARPWLENSLLILLAFFVTFMALEFYFKLFFAQSDSITTLANRNWNERYLDGTLNSLGYRDVEWTDDLVAGKTKVMVVGDSFVEGTGIEYPKDRFSDRLGQLLGPTYVVFNLGKGGADTGQEIKAITRYPYRPDILILSYFVNDIEGVAGKLGGLDKPPRTEISPWLYPLVQNSYAINFLYWRLYRLAQAGQPDRKWEWQLSLINNPEAWWLHQQQLLTLYEGTKSEKIPLIAVVFPSMNDTVKSQAITEPVLHLYRQVGVPTLNVAELIQDIPVNERIATPVDPHPSELVHERVAQALHQMLIDLGLTNQADKASQLRPTQ